ncbi:MAG: hypothetical protein GXO74_13300 [Calditrichaeota bacterium]|nr:hypothetical protein [Calditrichota bacterium]
MKFSTKFAVSLAAVVFVFWHRFLFAQNFEDQLQREDKHFLGGGKMLVWASEYLRFLHSSGFRDHGCFLDEKVAPLSTVTFVGENLKEISTEFTSQTWVPSHFRIDYQIKNALHFSGLLYVALSCKLEIAPKSRESCDERCAVGASEQKAIEAFDSAQNIDDLIQSSIGMN